LPPRLIASAISSELELSAGPITAEPRAIAAPIAATIIPNSIGVTAQLAARNFLADATADAMITAPPSLTADLKFHKKSIILHTMQK
jgi:hypothetical protein